MEKVYAILYNAYEFDDLSYGDLTPKFLSLDKNKCIEQFNIWKTSDIKNFNEVISVQKEWLNDHPEYKEDYQIKINTDDEFELYVGNWCYHYALVEYELDKALKV